jgi:hypothetical protein
LSSDCRQALHEFALAGKVARARREVRRGGERRTQCHAGTDARLAGACIRVDDALMILGIHHDQGHRFIRQMQRTQGQLWNMRRDPQLARLELERRC